MPIGTLVPFPLMAKNEPRTELQTTIRISTDTWRRLRALAEGRALKVGGRPSASAVVEELVEAEAKRQRAEGRRA